MTFLDSYGLRGGLGNPFEPRPSQRVIQPPPIPQSAPEIPRPQAPQFTPIKAPAADTSGDLSNLSPQADKPNMSAVADALAKADETLRRLRGMELPYPRETAPQNAPMRRTAMSPLDGPDTGEENPNSDGAPGGYFRRLRGAESTNDDTAINKVTGAAGRYQIQPRTFDWLARENPQLGLDPKRILDADQQEKAVRAYTDKSMRQLVPALGRMPTSGELYALHFLGHSGGMQFLGGLERPARDVIRAADFKANPWLYKYADKPASALLNRFNAMMGDVS